VNGGHAAWDELAAGHAVNALEPEDEQAFLDHLRGCDQCRATLASLEDVTGTLAYAAEPADPPAALRSRILDAAAAERPATFGTRPPRHDLPRERRPRVWQPTFHLASLATAAAVVAVLALGFWNLSLRGDGNAKQAALRKRTEALSCLAAADTRTFELTSVNGQHAKTCLAGGSAYVVVDRLDENDTGSSVYVLWWMDAQQALHPVAGFDVEVAGTSVYRLPLDVTPSDVRAMAVSLEPGRAVPAQPTRRIVSGAATSA
jgi:hypothetical protein